ncbi:MAG TPA: FkbM family methyltransferase [Granulicella sp.]|jgi:FkbM family methyltransferase|nr:FkbM family methyltransferase [Granulicella sp.]
MHPWQIKVRSIARRTGVIRLIHRMRPAAPYEQRVHAALAGAVRPGDLVWDVGANVGVYSELFCQWVGSEGFVVAFEPFSDCCERIRERVPECAWLRVENIALGESDTTGRLMTSEDSVQNHIASEAEALKDPGASVTVEICRGDTVCSRLGRVPNVVKVDVEGFEEEVLAGMGKMLTSPTLRSVLVEVHFSKLELRGRAHAPVRIERLLGGKGFRTRWVDASHLFANR